MVNSTSNLLIIGNGFDLQCGLKSSYYDFVSSKFIDKIYSNLWQIYFQKFKKEINGWIDIENKITYFLSNRNEKFSFISELKNQGHNIIIDNNDNLSFVSYLLGELKKIEDLFCQYLLTEIENNKNYTKNAENLLKKMAEFKNLEIISFNYTNPFKENIKVINLHGLCKNSNIIFGIDLEDKLPKDSYIFTKTYRRMFLNNSTSSLPRDISKIKFYGHSLGYQDHSYFYNIFDYYNLYGDLNNSNIILQFYFTIYDNNKKDEIIKTSTTNVYNLIYEYGKTFDDTTKGKNILNKLLLEGRIHIKFI